MTPGVHENGSAPEIDPGPVAQFTQLRALRLAGAHAVDLRRLSRLELLALTWHRRLVLPEALPALTRCTLWRYTPTDGRMTAFIEAPMLRHLELIQGTVRDLRGLPASVTELELVKLPQLWSLDGLPSSTTDLRLEGCRELRDYRALHHCRHLRTLVLSDCGPIPSLRFMRAMSELQRVVILGTTQVVDGDLTPLLAVRDARFTDRAGYNLTMDQWRQASRR